MTDSAPPTSLWLLRHPEPESSAAGRCYGVLDVELSDSGVRQAHAIAEWLAAVDFAAVCTSPSRRCSAAAGILAAGRCCPVHTIDALRELNFGEFEGRTYNEIAASHPDLYRQWMERPGDVRFPGGESLSEMRVRVLAAVRSLRERYAGQSVALVTHGGVIRILIADALGLEPTTLFRIGQRYAGASLIRYFGESAVVELLNGGPASLV